MRHMAHHQFQVVGFFVCSNVRKRIKKDNYSATETNQPAVQTNMVINGTVNA